MPESWQEAYYINQETLYFLAISSPSKNGSTLKKQLPRFNPQPVDEETAGHRIATSQDLKWSGKVDQLTVQLVVFFWGWWCNGEFCLFGWRLLLRLLTWCWFLCGEGFYRKQVLVRTWRGSEGQTCLSHPEISSRSFPFQILGKSIQLVESNLRQKIYK